MKRGVIAVTVALVVAALAGAGYVFSVGRDGGGRFRTAKVDRGPVVVNVATTGALNAVTTVQVGSQVSGQIKELLVDFNSPVKRGQLIARLDPEIFQAKVRAARADLESAQAAVLNQRANVERARAEIENARASAATADANIERMRADLENARALIATAQANIARESAMVANARLELERRIDLRRRDLISQSEKDQAQTAFETASAQLEAARAQERAGHAALRSAQAQLLATQSQARAAQAQVASTEAARGVAEAQLKSAEAGARQKLAALEQARLDLEHTEIRAPVNGVVVSRTVDVGQTVAASLQAPTLFTIAEDLARMQVEAAVDEADVGRLRQGMPSSFTVDAFPGRTFQGEIVQIRKSPQVVQNVVTYTVVIAVTNPDLTLLPGMTANVRIQIERKEDVLRVPNAALRYRPPGDATAPGGAPGAGRTGSGAAGGAGPASGGGNRQLRDTLVRELALDADQQGQLDAILGEARQAFANLRSQGGDEGAREAQRRRIREESREKIRAILKPDQRPKYEALVAAQDGGTTGTAARVFVPGPDGKPKAVPIVVGATDGTASEVLQGDLQPGQEVITGQPPSTPARSGGPRLRL
jgi:HlyD family secretion protein